VEHPDLLPQAPAARELPPPREAVRHSHTSAGPPTLITTDARDRAIPGILSWLPSSAAKTSSFSLGCQRLEDLTRARGFNAGITTPTV